MGKAWGSSNRLALATTTVALACLVSARENKAQTLGPPPPFKAVVTVRGGGIDHMAPHRVPQRLVQGTVRDKNDKGISHAQVFLSDARTKEVRQQIADENGKFLFGGLSLDHDFQVWVKVGSADSEKKFISTAFGNHDVTENFRIDMETHSKESAVSTPAETAPASHVLMP